MGTHAPGPCGGWGWSVGGARPTPGPAGRTPSATPAPVLGTAQHTTSPRVLRIEDTPAPLQHPDHYPPPPECENTPSGVQEKRLLLCDLLELRAPGHFLTTLGGGEVGGPKPRRQKKAGGLNETDLPLHPLKKPFSKPPCKRDRWAL